RGAAELPLRRARVHSRGRRGGRSPAGDPRLRRSGRRHRGDHRPRAVPPPVRRGARAERVPGILASHGLSTPPEPSPTSRPRPAAAGPPDRKAYTMAERTVTIASASGLHARPAGIFAQAAAQQPATVTIEKAGGSAVQASSMLMLITLGAGHGDEVTLRAEGEGAEESVNALADLLEKDLDAEE